MGVVLRHKLHVLYREEGGEVQSPAWVFPRTFWQNSDGTVGDGACQVLVQIIEVWGCLQKGKGSARERKIKQGLARVRERTARPISHKPRRPRTGTARPEVRTQGSPGQGKLVLVNCAKLQEHPTMGVRQATHKTVKKKEWYVKVLGAEEDLRQKEKAKKVLNRWEKAAPRLQDHGKKGQATGARQALKRWRRNNPDAYSVSSSHDKFWPEVYPGSK